jgi:hypothetical protein
MKQHRKTMIIGKLRRGERYWPAEIVLRASGLSLLGLCAILARLVVADIQHSLVETPPEFLLAALVFAGLTGGLALLLFGPRLFKLMPTPPRALLP